MGIRGSNPIIVLTAADNPIFIDRLHKSRVRFEALREFTLDALNIDQEQRAVYGDKECGHNGDNATATAGASSSLTNPDFYSVRYDEDEDHSSPPLMSRASTASTMTDATPTEPGQPSRKAQGKQPAHGSLSSERKEPVVGTNPSSLQWLAELPLHTILTLFTTLDSDSPLDETPSDLPPPAPQTIDWTLQLQTWYLTTIWASAYKAQLTPDPLSSPSSSSGGGGGSGAGSIVGVWTGTNVRLFRIEVQKAQGPSLERPSGAIDALGSRLGNLILRGTESVVGGRFGRGTWGEARAGAGAGSAVGGGRQGGGRQGTGRGRGNAVGGGAGGDEDEDEQGGGEGRRLTSAIV